MSYENLLMQNVVASVEATDDIPRRFITFMRGLVERPDDFHFKFGERTCKIATLKSQFAVDNGGCAGHIVIETELEHQKESRLGFKLTRGTGNGGTRLTLTFNPSQLLAGDGVAPTLRRDPPRRDDDDSAPESPTSSQFVSSKLLGLGFDILNELYEIKNKHPLIYDPRLNDSDIRLERVDWDALIQTKDPREFLLFLVLLFEPVFTANDDGRPLRLADLLKLKTSCGFDPRTGELDSRHLHAPSRQTAQIIFPRVLEARIGRCRRWGRGGFCVGKSNRLVATPRDGASDGDCTVDLRS